MILSKKTLASIAEPKHLSKPGENVFGLPEKVLQFGTGVLLRGLPGYFIDKANRQGVFNGRVVMVKSTDRGDTHAYEEQDGLFTLCVRGIENGEQVDENIINAAISRVLSAQKDWEEILKCATNPEMQLIISNTTEIGITLLEGEDIGAAPPFSFPGKLLAFLYRRFKDFQGDWSKGMVIVPTELIPGNGEKLKDIVRELARRHPLEQQFMEWLEGANHFCNSLVDRIVPGSLPPEEQAAAEKVLGYEDRLMIATEPYHLWAIESAEEKVKEVLSFQQADKGLIIAPDIEQFRELKLRLLNGTHTFACGLALLRGLLTVKEAMDDVEMLNYISGLMLLEIAPSITSEDLTMEEAKLFSRKVADRFRNPFIRHQWLSIAMQDASKMKMRNLPVLLAYYERFSRVPERMALGFAAHLLFMKCEQKEDGKYYGVINGNAYCLADDHAAYYAEKWKAVNAAGLVKEVLGDRQFWGTDLSALPGFVKSVTTHLQLLMQPGHHTTTHHL